MSGKERLLYLTPVVPEPTGSGLRMRSYWVREALRRHNEVHTLALWPWLLRRPPGGVKVLRGDLSTVLKRLLHELSPKIYQRVFQSPAGQRFLPGRSNLSGSYHRIHVHRLDLLPLIRHAKRSGVPVDMDLDDLESTKFKDFAELCLQRGRPGRASFYLKEAELYRQLENEAASLCHTFFVCSESDRERFERESSRRATCLPNVVPPRTRASQSGGQPFTLLFAGGLDYFPNHDGLEFFLQKVWPRLGSDVRLTVVGGGRPNGKLRRLLRTPGVDHRGFVAAMDSSYATSHVLIAPIFSGSGTRIKILDAMAAGVPVLTTAKGAEGLDFTFGQELLLANDEEEFAEQIFRLRDPDLRRELTRAAHQFVSEHHHPERLADILNPLA